jgi:hypothetical protein
MDPMDTAVNLLLALHVLVMGAPATLPLLAAWFEFREGRGDRVAGVLGRRLLGASLGLFLIGALLGLVVGWVQWDRGLSDALARLASRVHYGVLELIFSLVLLVGQWLWWRSAPEISRVGRGVRALLGILAGTNLLYHFPVLFAVISHLVHLGEATGEVMTAAEFRKFLTDPAVSSRVVHVVLAYLAGAGIAVIAAVNWFPAPQSCLPASDSPGVSRPDLPDSELPPSQTPAMNEGGGRGEHESGEHLRQRFSAWGAYWAVGPTVAQVPTGLWVFTQLSPVSQGRLLGGDLVAAGLLVAGIASALWMLHLLASICMGEHNRRVCRRVTWVFVLTMILMTLSSRRVMSHAVPPRPVAGGATVTFTRLANQLDSLQEGANTCPSPRAS